MNIPICNLNLFIQQDIKKYSKQCLFSLGDHVYTMICRFLSLAVMKRTYIILTKLNSLSDQPITYRRTDNCKNVNCTLGFSCVICSLNKIQHEPKKAFATYLLPPLILYDFSRSVCYSLVVKTNKSNYET